MEAAGTIAGEKIVSRLMLAKVAGSGGGIGQATRPRPGGSPRDPDKMQLPKTKGISKVTVTGENL
jgi:hypothetical protein